MRLDDDQTWLSLDINDGAAGHFLWLLFTSPRTVMKSPRLLDHIGNPLRLRKLTSGGTGAKVNGDSQGCFAAKRDSPRVNQSDLLDVLSFVCRTARYDVQLIPN